MLHRKIKGFPDYRIYESGMVYSFKRNIVLRPSICRSGYSRVFLTNNKDRSAISVHRLVASHFVKGRTRHKKEVNHRDGNKRNNNASNLEWVTHKQNMAHARAIGLIRGRKCKYKRNKIIKFLRQEGFEILYIAEALGMTTTNVHRILKL